MTLFLPFNNTLSNIILFLLELLPRLRRNKRMANGMVSRQNLRIESTTLTRIKEIS